MIPHVRKAQAASSDANVQSSSENMSRTASVQSNRRLQSSSQVQDLVVTHHPTALLPHPPDSKPGTNATPTSPSTEVQQGRYVRPSGRRQSVVIDSLAMWANPLAADFNAHSPPLARRLSYQAAAGTTTPASTSPATAAVLARDDQDLTQISASTPKNVKMEHDSAHNSVACVKPPESLNLKDNGFSQTEVSGTKHATVSSSSMFLDLATIHGSSPSISPLNLALSGILPSHIHADNQASTDSSLSGSFNNRAARRLTAALSLTRSSIHSGSDFLGDDVGTDDTSEGTQGTPDTSSIMEVRDVPRGPLVDGVRTRECDLGTNE